jgi:hypothetical protein
MHLPLLSKQVLVGNPLGSAEQRYYAFPSILRLKDGSVLIAYKNGEKHLLDSSAPLDVFKLDPDTGRMFGQLTVGNEPGWIYQNPELMRMPDDSIMLYCDIQVPGNSKTRIGLRVFRSMDEGESFQDEGWFPQVGDYVYGYSFDDAVSPASPDALQPDVDMLIMSFPELVGGERAVHAVRSGDNGRSWTYIRNLNREFDFAFNESSLVAYEGGYVLAARGDDKATRLYRTDSEFRMLAQRDLSQQYDSIEYIGRPELFWQDERLYLLCRNIAPGQKIGTLRLYRIDPATIEVKGYAELHANDCSAGDSYYAEQYRIEREGNSYLNIITYVPQATGNKPDIVRLEYDWKLLMETIG